MNDDLQQKIAAALEQKIPMADIAAHLASHENPEYSAYGKSFIESQAAPATKRSDYQEEKKNLMGTITPMLNLINENPKEALAAGAAAIGIPYAIKTKNAIEDRRMKKELHQSEIKKNEAYAQQVKLQEQKLVPSTELSHADIANMVKTERNVTGKPNPLAASFEEKFKMPLAEAEQLSNGKITNAIDAEIVGNSLTKGRGFSVNPIPGTVSNQPAGVPGAANPMDKLTQQPPAPQLIQPKPPVAPVNAAPPAPPAAPTSVSDAVATGQNPTQALNESLAKDIDAATPKPAAGVAPSSAIKVEGLVRDAQGNFQYPPGMSPAAIEGHKAFNQQYPEHARALEAEGKFGIVGGGAADNSLRNSYGSKLRKQILNEVNQGQLGGINTNYLENINPAIKALSTESGLGKTLAELKANNPKGGIHGPLGTPATIGKLGELVSKPGAVSGLVNKGSIPLLLMAMAEAANANQSKSGNAVVPPKTSEGGAAFGGFTSGKKYQSAKLRAEQGDVNTLPDPRTYAAVQSLMGVPPDQLGFSVLHPDYKNIRDVADPAYAASILATLLSGLSKFGKK